MAKIIAPPVLAFERKIAPSDGCLFGTSWGERRNKAIPLKLQEKSVRGTISHRLTDRSSAEKEMNNKEDANLQTVDVCSLPFSCDTLVLDYSLKFLSGVEIPSACNDVEYQEAYEKLVRNFINNNGFVELAYRYAQNIASGRALWRNRFGTEKIETIVTFSDGSELVFDSLKYSVKKFYHFEELKPFADKIADAFCGRISHLFVRVKTFALVGAGQEVFPSEDLVFNLSRDNRKSKFLYDVDGCAALHSQKIGNAIRTVDTWYPNAETLGFGPIAAEVYGSVTARGKAYRSEKGSDFYSIFDNAVNSGIFGSVDDANYTMAVLLRGGVFGAKKDKKKKESE